MKLKDLAHISMGLAIARKKAELSSDVQIPYKLVSLKSFNSDGIYKHQYSDDFLSTENINDSHLVKKGDILLRLREPNYAVYIDKDYKDLIASSLMAVIKLHDNHIDPLYLTAYLNSSQTKKQLASDFQSTQIPTIKLSNIAELSINVPDIKTQKNLVQIQQLHLKEIELLEEIITEKTKLNKAIFEKISSREIN